ncbi:MAG: CRTAC1 family protein [Acidobacteriota bacterium]|nr:MAG: CRTAC1 family protein [Acidobacteriota bacterium]
MTLRIRRDAPARWSFLILSVFLSCASVRAQSSPDPGPSGNPSPTQFVDITEQSGVRFRQVSSATSEKYLPETMGSGVALLDHNGDGRLDIFFANGALIEVSMPKGKQPDKSEERFSDRLYEQQPDGTFTDITARSGLRGKLYGTGVAVADYDNDGDPDIFVGGIGSNVLYRNEGAGKFTDVTTEMGVSGSGWTSSVAFVDYNHDGFLDLIVGRYLDWDFDKNIYCGETEVRAYCHPENFGEISPLLYRTDQGKRFIDATEESGVSNYPGKALGVGIADINRDGLIDIFISNDGMEQFLLENQGDGTFEEVALFSGVAMDQNGNSFAGMGVDVADYDNDGLADIVVTNLSNEAYALYQNEGNESFVYVSDTSGLSQITLLYAGWGVRFIDFDNDGWRDLFIIQGHVLDTIEITSPHLKYAQPPFLLRNLEGKSFENVSASSGEVFSVDFVGRGLATGDLDNDGDLDVVVSNLDSPAVIFRNDGGNRQNWIQIRTVGTRSNRDGIGAEVQIETRSGQRQYATVTTTSSYQSSSHPRLHFGLGEETEVGKLEIHWPSGIRQTLTGLKANQLIVVEESE